MSGMPEFMAWWMVVFWAVIVGLVVWGIKQFFRNRGERSPKEDTPIEIAQKRLARGDITKEQFDELREALR